MGTLGDDCPFGITEGGHENKDFWGRKMKHAVNLKLCVLIAFLSGCGSPESIVTPMKGVPHISLSEYERIKLENSLRRLDAAIEAKAPKIFEALANGASDDQIQDLRDYLGGSTHEPLETWFRWRNGITKRGFGIIPFGSPLSIEHSILFSSRERNAFGVGSRRSKSLLFLDDMSGDGFFIDLFDTEAEVYYEMTEDPYPRRYGTLSEFVQFIAAGFETGILFEDENGFLDYDESRYSEFVEDHIKDRAVP